MRCGIMFEKLKITFDSGKKDFIAFGIFTISSILIFFLTLYVLYQNNNQIDSNIFILTREITNPTGLKIARIVTIFGTGNFLIPAYIILLSLLSKRNYTSLVYKVFAAAFGGLLLGWLLKWIFHRSRPLDHLVNGAGGYSFPSGHALGGFIFFGIALYLVWNMKFSYFIRWTCSILFFLLGFSIGISRIYLHVHYTTDVLGSLFIAIWWLSLMQILFGLFFKNSNYRAKDKLKAYQAL